MVVVGILIFIAMQEIPNLMRVAHVRLSAQ